jgi:trimethylamine--corrinoid protein Co-methyltransferase
MIRNPRAGARKSGGFRLEVFTEDELREIHLATLEVLGRTGVFVEDDEAREIFAAAGAEVDRETDVVRLPAHLVEDAAFSMHPGCPWRRPPVSPLGRSPSIGPRTPP